MSEGPIERAQWPEQLTAHVVDEGRVHGYRVGGDLDRHHSWLALVVLALTGELPDAGSERAVELALMHLSPVSAGDAPVHAAILAKIAGGPDSPTVHLASLAAADQARHDLREFASVQAWMSAPTGEVPESVAAADQNAAVERLEGALRSSGVCGERYSTRPELNLVGNALWLLAQAGFKEREGVELLLTLARLPVAVAEAQANRPSDFSAYPVELPPLARRASQDAP